jgi:hypothetical protein
MTNDTLSRLLIAVFRHRIREPDADAGLDHLVALLGGGAALDEARLAVRNALEAGYIHDPVRLPAGALQCFWHLELTPRGVEAARLLHLSVGDVQ